MDTNKFIPNYLHDENNPGAILFGSLFILVFGIIIVFVNIVYRLITKSWNLKRVHFIIADILLASAQLVNVPVPRWTDYHPGPANSLRTSAEDLGWGMGPGILFSNQGYALWQWGQYIDFQSFMIIYPEYKFGSAEPQCCA